MFFHLDSIGIENGDTNRKMEANIWISLWRHGFGFLFQCHYWSYYQASHILL